VPLVFPEHRGQVPRDRQLFVGLLLLVDHALHALVHPAHLDQRILVLPQLGVVQRLERGDHQLLEVLSAVGPLPLAGDENLGLLAHRHEVEPLAQLVRLGEHLDALLELACGVQDHSLVHHRQQLIDLRAGLDLAVEALDGRRVLVRLVGMPVSRRAGDVVAGAPVQEDRERPERDRPADREERVGHVRRACRRALGADALLDELLLQLLLVLPDHEGSPEVRELGRHLVVDELVAADPLLDGGELAGHEVVR